MFYTFHQNNSGGYFIFDSDKGISVNVIIEANSADEANDRAEQIGLYFNGVADESDCSCCGDRWYSVWDENDGTELPEIWGEPVAINAPMKKEDLSFKWAKGPEAYIHYLDGTIVPADL